MKRLGSILRHHRRRQGKSLKVVAEQAGMTKSYVSMIERGRVPPPVNGALLRLANALNADKRELLLRAWVERSPRIIRSDLRRMLARLHAEKPSKGLNNH